MEENKESLLEPSENAITEIISVNVICRLCANQNDKQIGIFSENGLNNDLASKMNLYLPIKVYETDELPLQCCWQCASTVLAWHDLFLTSLEADRRLRSYQFVSERQLKSVESYVETDSHQQEDEPEGTKQNVLVKNESEQMVKPEVAEYETSNESLGDLVTLEPRYLQLNPVVYEIEKQKIDEPDTENSKPEDIDQLFEGEPEHSEEKDTTCYGCQTCQMVFLNEQEMVVHLSEVHPEEDFKPSVQKNSKKDKRKNTKIDQDLVNSAKIIVDGKIYYNCKECGRCLHSPYTYVWHMRIHTGERPHTCHLCGKCFRVSQGLVRHLKETHQGIKNFPCDLCGRMFATRRNVEEHRRIHTNERPYVCDLCGKSFKQKASLFVHNRSHTDSFPFKCSYCEQMFRTKPPLMIHITKHTGEKPYPCDICGRHFRIKYELKRHRLIHSDEKPFACVMCGLSFKQKRYLKNHNKQNHSTLDLAT